MSVQGCKSRRVGYVIGAALLSCPGCSDAPVGPSVATVEITSCPVRLRGIGASGVCSASVQDADGTVLDLGPIWCCTDRGVVQVDEGGRLTSTGFGRARISATVDTVTTAWDIRVTSLTRLEEAQRVAVYLSGELWPPPPLTERAFGELEAIRETFGDDIPIVDWLRFKPPWDFNSIVVRFTEEGVRKFRSGEYDAWDALNAELRVTRIDSITIFAWSGSVILEFGPVLHMDRAGALYRSLPDIRSVSRNGGLFDGPAVYPRATDSSTTYLFRDAEGYCYVGRCTYNEYSYFEVGAEGAVLRGIWNLNEDPETPAWWDDARQNVAMWQ